MTYKTQHITQLENRHSDVVPEYFDYAQQPLVEGPKWANINKDEEGIIDGGDVIDLKHKVE